MQRLICHYFAANENLNLCQFNDEEDDCRYFFTYEYVENNEVEVKVQQTKGGLLLYIQIIAVKK